MVIDSKEYTADDLLKMPDGSDYELVDGHLVERPMGFQAGLVTAEVIRRISNHCHDQRLGYVTPGGDGGYQCFPDRPRLVRKPDVAFVRLGRFPNDQLPMGYATLAPDLAVEVVSPNDLYEELEKKVVEYFRAGVRLVWVVSPESRTVLVQRPDGPSRRLFETDELLGEEVLPGFRCLVSEFFPYPRNSPASEA
jgi:Uma2 family endonuclease